MLALSDRVVSENKLTALMVTHNMHDAIAHGNRLIMMSGGRIVYDVSGEEKQKLTIDALIKKFSESTGQAFASDKALLG